MPTFTNRILLNKDEPTSLALLRGHGVVPIRIDVYGREKSELPGNLNSMTLSFGKEGMPADLHLTFLRQTFLVQLDREGDAVQLNHDYCEIYHIQGELLDKEELYLYFTPAIPNLNG